MIEIRRQGAKERESPRRSCATRTASLIGLHIFGKIAKSRNPFFPQKSFPGIASTLFSEPFVQKEKNGRVVSRALTRSTKLTLAN
jgi:hypothetical protein